MTDISTVQNDWDQQIKTFQEETTPLATLAKTYADHVAVLRGVIDENHGVKRLKNPNQSASGATDGFPGKILAILHKGPGKNTRYITGDKK